LAAGLHSLVTADGENEEVFAALPVRPWRNKDPLLPSRPSAMFRCRQVRFLRARTAPSTDYAAL